jgi:hypothetical protein
VEVEYMFKIKTNEEIGEYLKELIEERYGKTRRFCKAYLKLEGRPVDDDEIRKMANRMSQIIKGSKAIQTYDLPIFTELLDVTCEQILSAGEYCVQKNHRTTNYSIAFSKSKKEWDEYIKREDKLILNPDEYDKTVIDYAIEAGNYKFIKYLIDHEYIWFVDNERNFTYFYKTFGAGTNIERRKLGFHDMLQYKLDSEDNLRMGIISLAAANNDFETLEMLKAREIPMFYNIVKYSNWRDLDRENVYEPSRLVKIIADASDEIIEYFTTPFEVTDPRPSKDSTARSYTFVFPFYSELLSELVKRNHKYTEFALRTAIEHNKNTYEQLKRQIENSVNDDMKYYSYVDENYLAKMKKDFLFKMAQEVDFYKKLHILGFSDYRSGNITRTNIISTSNKSSNLIINHLIEDVNSLYNKIIHIQDEYDTQNEE